MEGNKWEPVNRRSDSGSRPLRTDRRSRMQKLCVGRRGKTQGFLRAQSFSPVGGSSLRGSWRWKRVSTSAELSDAGWWLGASGGGGIAEAASEQMRDPAKRLVGGQVRALAMEMERKGQM